MPYFPKIDGLRSLAIIMVIIHHAASIFSKYVDLGYAGVDLFFVISGFLITTILLKSKEGFSKSYKIFFARRSLRIFPLYYFSLLILLLLGHPIVVQEIGYLLTYTYNYRYPFVRDANPIGHFWTLGVEEQYYLFWPFLVLGLKRKLPLLMLVTFLMIIFAYLQIYFHLIPSISVYNYTGLPTRMGSLGLGSLGAMFYSDSGVFLKKLLHEKSIEVIMVFLWFYALIFTEPLLLGFGSLFMVLKAAENSFNFKLFHSFLEDKRMLFLGRISYGLYVYHVIVIFYGTKYLFDPVWKSIDWQSFGRLSILQFHSWIIKLPLYSSITIILSVLSFKYIEQPISKLKDIYFKN
ncbi:acyltransferase family protein [Mongoliitalea lutea]|uniref:Acyltransferase 3 domain-containing protein n=1 Tax=Mongoliitalea lutea TaxID=849756 RepID=A0A8J3CX71_9BACT|nr:acyltransferase [Mongoliitalea lutea]GHB37148.1 hypothetical protein GCM10008106_18050 [Mongoliitalea lutea]